MVPSPEGRTTPLHFLDGSAIGNRRNSGKCFLPGVIQAHFCRFSPTASSKGMYRSPVISPPSLTARLGGERRQVKPVQHVVAATAAAGETESLRWSLQVKLGKAHDGKMPRAGPCVPRNTCAGDHATWRLNRWVAGGASLAERSLFFAA